MVFDLGHKLFRLDERSPISLNACLRLPHRPEMTVLQSQTACIYTFEEPISELAEI